MALFALVATGHASASHFRYGHYNWHPGAGPTTIDFSIQNAWRRDANPCYTTTGMAVPCTGPGGQPGIGDNILEFTGATVFDPGNGSGTIGSPWGPLMYDVSSIDPANNWLLGSALDPSSFPAEDPLVTHVYAMNGDYVGFTDSCCRISASDGSNYHMNNPDGGYRVETRVNVGTQVANSSPVSGMPPIVLCPINGLCTFQVPASDPNGDPLNYRLSTAAEASSVTPGVNHLGTQCPATFCQPGPPFSTNAASISSTGLYTWNTAGAQLAPAGANNTLYSTQVTIEDLNLTGAVKSKVAVDFLIQLVESIGTPPHFDHPPTPPCGSTINGTVGSNMTFTVQASDDDPGDVVTLNVVGLPPGATMTPPLPTMGNPVSSVFNWTPAAPGTFVVTFTATDQTLQQAICPLTLVVTTMMPPPPPVCPPDDDDDGDGLTNRNENLVGTLLGVRDSDDDGIVDGNDDANGNGEDDEDEDDDDDCPDEDEDGDGEDDEDEDDDEDDD